ncbi:hypothetical protein, partial [Enterobacter hormaechei]|uniref:hypothetical protein n=1 Tax=Enterobacter hormaechei TaxID=158836 RepID=UPI001C558185
FKSIRLGCLIFLVFCMKQFIPKLAAESRFDNWRQPVGQTESIANRLPAGRAKRVNPPLTAIFQEELA